MKLIGKCLALIILATSFYTSANVLDFSIHQEYASPRALAMGNAFSAVADDYNAIFYNPAALTERKTGDMRLFLRGAVSSDWDGLMNDIDGAGSDITSINNVIAKQYGNHFIARFPTMGFAWVRQNWGIAFIPMDFALDVSVNQSLGPKLGVNMYADSTFAYSYARKLKPKWLAKGHKLSVGLTGKAIHRIHFQDAVDAAALANNSDVFDFKRAGEGLTFDVDISAQYTPQFAKGGFLSFMRFAKPTFTAMVRNLLDMGYPVQLKLVSDLDEPAKPPKLQRRFDFGSKFELPRFWVFTPKVAFDIRDIGHSNWNFKKGLHAGAELYWTMFKWWKGSWSVGINQGYFTAGLGAKLGVFQFDFATWGEEVGTSDVPSENRRYMLEMALDF